ncbi:MAG: hypothetical protein MUF40_06745 [Gemmatimonadaceae bacterium]|nr:hypothetical protein [Gemmatimonadaceae bacterium]
MTVTPDDPLARVLAALAAREAEGRRARDAVAAGDPAALAAALTARDALAAPLAQGVAALADAAPPARAAARAAVEAALEDDAALGTLLIAARDEIGRELAQLDAGESAAGAYQGRSTPRMVDIVR